MKKAIVCLFLIVMIAQIHCAKSNVECAIQMMSQIGLISTQPELLIQNLSACAGDQTWAIIAPFIGGLMRCLVWTINSKGQAAGVYSTGMNDLALYNIIMDMTKQAFGELQGFVDTDGFRYQKSNQ